MLYDRRAEHIPGCNMAFRRDRLLELGGFDPQFTQAGDDVDICWRFLDAGFEIGYAPAALVWHHRRSTARAYCRQQKGYGRAEAMLQFKHPNRFNAVGCSRWRGVIYGEGAVGLPLLAPVVYHGRFGSGLFQMVYRRTDYSLWAYVTLLEWYAATLFVGVLAVAVPPLAAVAGAMIAVSLAAAARSGLRAELPPGAPWWCRPLVAGLHLAQPVVRSWTRYGYRLRNKRVPDLEAPSRRIISCTKRISAREHDLYFESRAGRGREHLLDALVEEARRLNWHGNFDAEWESHDIELVGGFWHKIRLRTASEELGSGRRFTRVRCSILPTRAAALLIAGLGITTVATAVGLPAWVLAPLAAVWPAVAALMIRGRARCRREVSRLVWQAAGRAHLLPVAVAAPPVVQISKEPALGRESLAGGLT